MALCLSRTRSNFTSSAIVSLHLSSFKRPIYSDNSEEQEQLYLQSEAPFSLPSLEPSEDAELISKILVQHHNPFHAMESSMQLHGVAMTPHLFHQTLLRIRNVSKIAFAFFTWAHYHHLDYHHDLAAYDLIIDILGKVRQFDVAWQLIVEMDQKRLKPTFNTFAVLIRRLISVGLTRQAVRAFDDAELFIEKQMGCNEFCYVLDMLCKFGYVKFATELFNKHKSRFQPNLKMYTILIYGWCKINRIPMAERFFREVVEIGIEPNVVTYNVILNGICRRASLHPEERFEKTLWAADNLFDEMRKRGIEPDVTSYSIVLHVYTRAHKPDLSLDKLRAMKEKGICPSVATYTSVVKCLCSCGRLDDAEELLTEMVVNGVSPTAATYNCFFKEYRGRKDVDSALRLYGQMKEDSFCSPDMHTYNILLGMFTKLGRIDILREIWEDMKGNGIGPDLDSYTLLIHGLCEKRMWIEGCQYFVEMIERGFLPQKVTFETLYRGLIQSDMLRTWRRLKKKLEEESISFGSQFESYHFKPYKR